MRRGVSPLARLVLMLESMRQLIGVVLLCVACSSPSGAQSTDFPADAYTTVTSQAGDLEYAVRTAPSQPPTRGPISLLLTVTDAGGAPIDGLDLVVVPWMPAMGHGSSVTPSVTSRGEGDYLVSNLVLVMPGTWELRVTSNATTTVIPITVE